MRFIPALLCVISMILAGRVKCRQMTKRVRILREIELFLKFMRPRTEYLHEPVSKTVSVLSNHSQLSELSFLSECSRLCESGMDFPKAWANAVMSVPLKKCDEELLLSLGEAVVSANFSDILGVISLYETAFRRSAETALDTLENNRKMCMSVFSSIGILLGIIII